jgi:hypothetical protein
VRGLIEPAGFWIVLAIAVLIAICLWKPSRRFRRAMQEIREGAVADVNAAYCQPTAWLDVGNFSLLPTDSESYRLRIIARSGIFHHDIVDAEIRCTADQAGQLRKMLEEWKARARRLD